MSPLLHSHFSTNALPKSDRLAAWHEDISVIFDVEAAASTDMDTFYAHFDLYHFGHSITAKLDSSTARYVRTRKKAASDGMDSILVQLFLEGGVQFGVENRTTYANTGDIVIFDLAQPVDNINRKFRHITMVWPRTSIEEVEPNVHRWHGQCLPKHRPSTVLLKQHMLSSYELAPRFSQQEGLRVEASALALLGAAMNGQELMMEKDDAPAMKEMLTYQIKRYIRQNLGSVDLSPDQIAAHFGISRRQLYNLLQPVGGVTRYQTHLRLQRCLADLQNPQNAKLHISEIAYRWGFNNLATFNRNFRNSFGMKPSETRQVGTQHIHSLLPPVTKDKKLQAIQAEHQQWFVSLGI